MKFNPSHKRLLLCSLMLLTLTLIGPSFEKVSAQTITHVPLFTVNSISGDDYFGASVSGAGDVNGDGQPDIIVGAPSRNRPGVSYSRVFSGADGSVLYTLGLSPSNSTQSSGGSVSGAGDVDGDGFADLIVGASGPRVYSGFDGSILYTFESEERDGLGSSVSGVGDLNGDGRADLFVGAVGDDNNGSDSGSAQVFSGQDGSVLFTFNGDSTNDGMGSSVSGAGDVNNDGIPDLIAGLKYGGDYARVFSGQDGSTLHTFHADSRWDGFGNAVSGAGDVNGDGFDDLIVGASSDFIDGTEVGSASVFSGLDGSLIHVFHGSSRFDRFGKAVSGAGDVNGDGFDDLLVGATQPGVTEKGYVSVFSGFDGSQLYRFSGDRQADRFGQSVSNLGDINGDGLADFVVGALQGGENSGGYARVYVSQISEILRGDCNQDDVVNFLDINPFIALLASNTFLEEADCNQDGAVSFLDITPFIATLSGN